jgi:hypothetical protein
MPSGRRGDDWESANVACDDDLAHLLAGPGEPGGTMGSGVVYDRHYIPDGIVTIRFLFGIEFCQPGVTDQMPWHVWLESRANGDENR